MTDDLFLDFLSKNCKVEEHDACAGRWTGFGAKVCCSCGCHGKKGKVLGLVARPVANTYREIPPFVKGGSPE